MADPQRSLASSQRVSDRPGAGFPGDSTLPLLAAFLLALGFLGAVIAIMKDGSSGARPVATATTRTTARPAPAAAPEAPLPRVTLTVSTAGDGRGQVRIGSDVRDCTEEDCKLTVDEGEDVILAARPASDSTFVGWTGSCSSQRVCRVRMDRSLSLIALFALDKAAAPSSPDAECSDDFDNDGDDLIDDLDPECVIGDSETPEEDPLDDVAPPVTPPPPPVVQPPPPVVPPPPPPAATPDLPQR